MTHAQDLARGTLTLPEAPSDYLADDATVTALAQAHAAGAAAQAGTRATYLRVLLAHTQVALGAPRPTLHDAKRFATLQPDAALAQQKALKACHDRLYALVLDAITVPDLADSTRLKAGERSRRARLRNARSNFARSAAATLRAVSRSQYDLAELGVREASKGRLAALAMKRAPQEHDEQPQRRAALATARAITALEALAGLDHQGAVEAGQMLIDRAAALLLGLGTPSVRSMDKATEARRPLRTAGGTFWPVYKPDESRPQ
jgi:hypothetical protein